MEGPPHLPLPLSVPRRCLFFWFVIPEGNLLLSLPVLLLVKRQRRVRYQPKAGIPGIQPAIWGAVKINRFSINGFTPSVQTGTIAHG